MGVIGRPETEQADEEKSHAEFGGDEHHQENVTQRVPLNPAAHWLPCGSPWMTRMTVKGGDDACCPSSH